MRKYRRHGVGIAVATFWRRAILVPFEEEVTDVGPVQRFVIGQPS
jgi:hypothetical protein